MGEVVGFPSGPTETPVARVLREAISESLEGVLVVGWKDGHLWWDSSYDNGMEPPVEEIYLCEQFKAFALEDRQGDEE